MKRWKSVIRAVGRVSCGSAKFQLANGCEEQFRPLSTSPKSQVWHRLFFRLPAEPLTALLLGRKLFRNVERPPRIHVILLGEISDVTHLRLSNDVSYIRRIFTNPRYLTSCNAIWYNGPMVAASDKILSLAQGRVFRAKELAPLGIEWRSFLFDLGFHHGEGLAWRWSSMPLIRHGQYSPLNRTPSAARI